MPLIGLSGYARSGKDTIGGILTERHGFTRISFADKLRECALALNPIIWGRPEFRLSEVVEVEGWEVAKENPEVRRILQCLGTEVGRNILGPNVWVDAAMTQVDTVIPGMARVNEAFVLTDVRFPNEADAIRKRGGQLWRVRRPGFGPINYHPSETALDDFDFDHVIDNDRAIDDLKPKVARLLKED